MTRKNGKKKAAKKTAKRKRAKQVVARTGNGQWEPGQSGNPKGRIPGFDFRKALERYIDENDYDIDKAAGGLSERLLELGMAGDIQAAKLWLDRCYGPVTQEHKIEAEVRQGPSFPTGKKRLEWMEKFDELMRRER